MTPEHPSLDALRAYRPTLVEPPDLDSFWADTLADARRRVRRPTFETVSTPLRTLAVEDVTFSGFDGHRIRGWFLRPLGAQPGRLPTVIEYLGYGGGRSIPTARLFWPSAGYAYLVMDSRGQNGDTPDPGSQGASGHHPGFATLGIDEPATYYYRRLITDAVLAVTASRDHPFVDPDRIVVTGQSQGGGLALAVSGLERSISAAMIDVPFLCDIPRAIEQVDTGAYGEIVSYLAFRRDRAETALRTLSYVEGCHFAVRASAPALFSTGLWDTACPSSTVFAAFNHYAGPHRITVWPFNGHDAGELHQDLVRAAFLAELGLGPAAPSA